MTFEFGSVRLCHICRGTGFTDSTRRKHCLACGGSGWDGGIAPAHARTSDPSTSHAAAASITTKRQRQSYALILDAFRLYGPMTDETLYSHVGHEHDPRGQSPSGTRSRRAELVEMGRLRDSGRKATLPSGRKAIVWALADTA